VVDLCISSFQSGAEVPKETGQRHGRRCSDSTTVDNGSVVSSTPPSSDTTTSVAAKRKTTIDVASCGKTSSSTQSTTAVGLRLLRKSLKAKGIQGQTAKIVLASWRDSTRKQYASYLARWVSFCDRRKIDPLRATVSDVLTFLTELFNKGLGYSALNTARSAVAAVVLCEKDQSIGANPRVVRFLKGVFELRTPEPRYQQVWDVSILLNYLQSKGDNSELTLKELSQKLCSLLLLVSAHRVQSVHLIKLSDIVFTESGCMIVWSEKLKHTTAKKPNLGRKLKIDRFNDAKLCVVSCLEQYIKRTAELRCGKNTGKLILCYQKPYGAASKDTITRWLKKLLCEAGIENFGAHSFRSASASAMLKSGCPLDDILASAGWAKASTFERFYNRQVQKKPNESSKIILDYFGSQKKYWFVHKESLNEVNIF